MLALQHAQRDPFAYRAAHHDALAGVEDPRSSKRDTAGTFANGLSSPWCTTTTSPNASRNKLIQICFFPSQHILGTLTTG